MANKNVEFDFNNFLECGALFQTGKEAYILFEGPFESKPLLLDSIPSEPCLISPHFWDFMSNPKLAPMVLVASKTKTVSKNFLIENFSNNRIMEKTDLSESANLPKWEGADATSFKLQFSSLFKLFQETSLRKAVPINVLEGQWGDPQKVAYCLDRITKITSPGWSYGMWDSKPKTQSGFFGHSPEILFSANRQTTLLETMALAGTWTGGENVTSVEITDKIKNEHQLVIEDIKKQLEFLELQKMGATEVVALSLFNHLKTELTYKFKSFGEVLKAIELLHPTAALGIYPRVAKFYEIFCKMPLQLARKKFGAPFTLIEPLSIKSIVAIRNIIWENNQVQIFAGCGITSQSDLNAELEETKIKINSVKKIFGFESKGNGI